MTDVFGVSLEVETSGMQNGDAALDKLAKSGDKVDKSLTKVDKTLALTEKAMKGATISADDLADALDMDAAEFNATQKSIVTSLNASSQKLQSATLAVDRFEQDQKALGFSIGANGAVLDKQGVEVVRLTRRWQDLNGRLVTSKAQFDATQKSALGLANGTAKVNGGFKLMKGSAQQAGYQIGDFAVQMQMGTPFLTAFGQQAGQLAMILGPSGAVIGAIISISAAIGGIFVKSMTTASKEAEILSKTVGEITENLEKLERIELFSRIGDIEDTIKNTRTELEGLGGDLMSAVSVGLENGQKEFVKYLKGNTYEDILEAVDTAIDKTRVGSTKRLLMDLKTQLTNVNTIESEGFDNKNAINKVMAEIALKTRNIKELEQARLDIESRIGEIGAGTLDSTTKQAMALQTSKERLESMSAIESKKLADMRAGLRLRRAELELIQEIADTSNHLLTIEMSSKDAAIAKGRAQETVLKNQRMSAAESAISSAITSGKTVLELENERYQESLKLVREYADEKRWGDDKRRETEILLETEHQAKLLEIEKKGVKDRVATDTQLFTNLSMAADIYSNINNAIYAKQRAQLANDLANKENFSAAEIAIKEKTAKALFEKQKNADLLSIALSTSKGVATQLGMGNFGMAALVGAQGAAQFAAASALQYGGSGSAPSSGNVAEAPPSVQNNNNNSGGNIVNITLNNANSGATDLEALKEFFQADGVLFDINTAQGELLR